MNRDLFVTSSGSTAFLQFQGMEKVADRNATAATFIGGSSTSSNDTYKVILNSPGLMDRALQQQGVTPLEQVATMIVHLAAVTHFDELSASPPDEAGVRSVEMDAGHALELLSLPKLGDREIRRFIVRRVHQAYSRATLADTVEIDSFDCQLVGATDVDILRNAQLLEAEEYLVIDGGSDDGIVVRPTAKLVREVEQFGAAKADVASDHDYGQALAAYEALERHADLLRQEHRRFTFATTEVELQSVFRAVAPEIEAIAKELLNAHGSTSHPATLGPVIGELQNRGIGGPPLWAQMNHILKFSRDLAGHGSVLPVMVVRIACANAFELAPQMGSLFPR